MAGVALPALRARAGQEVLPQAAGHIDSEAMAVHGKVNL